MKKYYSECLEETYFSDVLDNGLTIRLMPKKDYSVTYAVLAVKFGSLDNKFIPVNQNEFVEVPLGVAHFLEHKMFEMLNGEDVNNLFAEIGADVNAYTTYDHTGYFFSTTRNLKKALTLLLDFVMNKGYTPKSIEEEKNIIEQELLMYLDNPNIRLQVEALKTLYMENLVREDIGGTIQSVRKINKDILDLCYDNFYQPENMCLVLVGNFDKDEIYELLKEHQKNNYGEKTSKDVKYYLETKEVNTKYQEIKMDVLIPKVSVNLKLECNNLTSRQLIVKDYALSALMFQEFDVTSDFYQKCLHDGIINNSFDFEIVVEKNYSHILVTSDTLYPERFIEAVKENFLRLKFVEISKESFNGYKKITEAQILRKMNNVEYFGNMLLESYFYDIELFDNLNIIKELTIDDVEMVRQYFEEDAISALVIKN
ncbi:MAG: insulinase family protein [Bacilli bacterium]|nr:insulinase family protein [Bacilli bacterium]